MPSIHVQAHPGKPPIVHSPADLGLAAAVQWLSDNRKEIRDELPHRGMLMIRNLPIAGADDFAAVRDVLTDQRAVYREQATPRSAFGRDVFSSTDLPARQSLRLHNENSYTLEFPGLLMFCCLQAPGAGGATTVADVREVLARLPETLVDRFRKVGWQLRRNYHDDVGLPWTTAFGTDSRESVAGYCRDNLIAYDWIGHSGLRTRQRRSALVRHPVTGDEVWFNHAAFWSRWSLEPEVLQALRLSYRDDGLPFDTAFGDGSELTAEDVAALNDAYDHATRRERWRPGDVLLVDNVLAAHGRDSYRGTRRILVAMGEPTSLAACSPTVAPAAA